MRFYDATLGSKGLMAFVNGNPFCQTQMLAFLVWIINTEKTR